MARYDREFLVPYLRSVCALELAHNKLCDRERFLSARINRFQQGAASIVRPKEPQYIPPMGGVFFRFFGFATLAMAVLMFVIDLAFLGWFFIFGAAVELGLAFYWLNDYKSSYERDMMLYNESMEEYNQKQKYNQQRRNEIPSLKSELAQCSQERSRAYSALQRVYSANIIPGNYRNLYASVYLYDWFSTSGADDVDMALNTFVLEEIKSRLDAIINQLSNVLLNQEIMKTNQQNAMAQQQQQSAMMRAKLNQIAASSEQRNRYLDMIESNTAAIAFFSSAQYIRNI